MAATAAVVERKRKQRIVGRIKVRLSMAAVFLGSGRIWSLRDEK